MSTHTKHITILGIGSWGMTLGKLLHENGHTVTLWDYEAPRVARLSKARRFDLLPWITIPKAITLSSDIAETCHGADIVVFATPSHAVRTVCTRIVQERITLPLIVSVVKGIEHTTLLRVSEIIHDVTTVPLSHIAVLSGPSHAEEVSKHIPTSVVIAGTHDQSITMLQKIFANHYFRVYTSPDIVGVELGGAIKNVIAIAAGICDGLKLGDNTKAALITRGLAEMTRLSVKLGAHTHTLSGLSGLGDLVVTCMSTHSRNRFVGEHIGKGQTLKQVLSTMNMVAEGVYTAQSVYDCARRNNVYMPITEEVYRVLYKQKKPANAVHDLMTKALKKE